MVVGSNGIPVYLKYMVLVVEYLNIAFNYVRYYICVGNMA